jgi:uncharacterized protein
MEFQIFIKPVGSLCNLGCSYCYYLDKTRLFRQGSPVPMPDDLLELYIRQHIEASTEPVIFFSWHGGEPLLAEPDFFRKAVDLQKKWKPACSNIINGVQTNGTLLDEPWLRFFAEQEFRLGISMDGPEDLHDQFRNTRDGKGSFQKALRGYDLALLQGIDPEILCVLNADNVKHPLLIYRYFKKLGAKTITFLPLVEHRTSGNRMVSSRSVNPENFGTFLCTVFDEWIEHDIGKVRIQIFEEALRTAFKQDHTLCIFKPVCGGVPVIEHNGDFFSCDHYVDEKHRIGNIRDISLAKMLDSDRQKDFGLYKQLSLPQFCLDCEVRLMCHGECPKNRFILSPTGEPGLNYLCAGYKKFFNHCLPFVESVSREYNRKNNHRDHRDLHGEH